MKRDRERNRYRGNIQRQEKCKGAREEIELRDSQQKERKKNEIRKKTNKMEKERNRKRIE